MDMNRADISKAVTQIDFNYINEALEADNSLSGEKKKSRYLFYRAHRLAACIAMAFMVASLAAVTAFAASESFRETVISLLYPIYSSDEIKALDNGHMTGSFDETDTLLSFLDRFNAEKMEFGIQAEYNSGYTYSMLSDSQDTILAVVECNISNYKILVTMERLDYEETTGIWQVVSYQMITSEAAAEVVKRVPAYVPYESSRPEESMDMSETVIEAEGICAVIYNANKKDNIITLTEQESRQIEEMLAAYEVSDSITAAGLQDMVIKYEDVMYAFSADGDVIVMEGEKVSAPCGQITLSTEDLEELLRIFSDYGMQTKTAE